MNPFAVLNNASAIALREIPQLAFADFRSAVAAKMQQEHCRLSAVLIRPAAAPEERLLTVILLDPAARNLLVTSTPVAGAYPALTPVLPAFHWFEREIWEEYGITPSGHPWLKPIRFSAPGSTAGATGYFTMQGDAVHEVAVGPVHAGVIEPGHFRFQCMGEEVYSLEIELGYQHRGVEAMLTGGPRANTPHLVETASGDSSIAAAFNYCRILEALTAQTVSPRANALRQLALELERIANHVGDLGALAGDVAFLPTASFCGRIRGDFLNLTALLCGNRFGRNLLTPGGCRMEPDAAVLELLKEKIVIGETELFHALDLMFDEPSVLDRLENTGTVDRATAEAIGLVGVAGRASGLVLDARKNLGNEFPDLAIPTGSGDVFSRAKVRYEELKASLAIVKKLLYHFPDGSVLPAAPTGEPAPEMLAVAVTEAWRGELCHAAVTGADGKFRQYKIVDPSFHNWFGLALALREQQISDFPICNKSFNLSYCGHDL